METKSGSVPALRSDIEEFEAAGDKLVPLSPLSPQSKLLDKVKSIQSQLVHFKDKERPVNSAPYAQHITQNASKILSSLDDFNSSVSTLLHRLEEIDYKLKKQSDMYSTDRHDSSLLNDDLIVNHHNIPRQSRPQSAKDTSPQQYSLGVRSMSASGAYRPSSPSKPTDANITKIQPVSPFKRGKIPGPSLSLLMKSQKGEGAFNYN